MQSDIAVRIGEIDVSAREHYLVLLLTGAILLHDGGVIQWFAPVVTQNARAVPHLEHPLYHRHAVILYDIIPAIGEDNEIHFLKPHRLDGGLEAVKLSQFDMS